MIKVYSESESIAVLVAIFDNEQTYNTCLPSLELDAKEHRMIVTESVDENDISQLECNLLLLENKIKLLEGEIAYREKRSVMWNVQDFEMRSESKKNSSDYDESKFEAALFRMIDKHDAEYGITWDTIDYYLDEYCKK